MAKTITEKNGHRSQPSKMQDTKNKARKNHSIMSRGDDGLKLPPDSYYKLFQNPDLVRGQGVARIKSGAYTPVRVHFNPSNNAAI
jgi:hypothetical protein